jgi:hypothetical protein
MPIYTKVIDPTETSDETTAQVSIEGAVTARDARLYAERLQQLAHQLDHLNIAWRAPIEQAIDTFNELSESQQAHFLHLVMMARARRETPSIEAH